MSAFNQMMSKTRDRNWGGTAKTVACEPYISGYSFIKWQLPPTLLDIINRAEFKISDSIGNTNDQTDTEDSISGLEVTLNSACTSVTPPTGSMNKVTFNGLGGSKWSVPGSMDYGDSISLRYVEFSGLPIFRIHRAWCNMIRDNKIGLTALQGMNESYKYNKADYSATLLYWTTKPDGVTVEYAAAFSGVFPLKDPMDMFTGDINNVDKLEIDIDYNVDMMWQEDWVWELAQNEAETPPHGTPNYTLWSNDGFRYSNAGADSVPPADAKEMNSRL